MKEIQADTKIAVLADIHGNSLALDAVLSDIDASGGADLYLFLGDYAAIGHDPIGVLESITQLDHALFIRGNTDRYLSEASQPWPDKDDAKKNADLIPLYIRVGRSFAWTTGAVGATGWLPWIGALPLELRLRFPDGTQALAVHASPGEDDGFGIHPQTPDDALSAMASATNADLIIVGHTHLPFDRKVGSTRFVNPGSVSNPLPPDLRASYALIQVASDGYDIQFRRVSFDLEKVVELAKRVNHPAWEYIASFMRGERFPDWMDRGDG